MPCAIAWKAVTDGDGASLRAEALHFGAHAAGETATEHVLVRHRSAPLQRVVKVLNGYSNNVFHYASATIGGPTEVEAIARERVAPELRDEIIIDNGAGAGSVNRLSPRAAAAILVALESELATHRLTLTDALPVSGIDTGTLRERLSETIVRFKPLSAQERDAYLAGGEWHGKAGGYAIQGAAEGLIAWISGSHSGVVGLPLYETRALLRTAGFALG